MNKRQIIARLSDIESRIKFLIQEYNLKQNQLQEYIDENSRLKQENEQLKEEIKSFHNQDKISKIATSVTFQGNESNEELKKQLDEYIKEIERCIAHLNE